MVEAIIRQERYQTKAPRKGTPQNNSSLLQSNKQALTKYNSVPFGLISQKDHNKNVINHFHSLALEQYNRTKCFLAYIVMSANKGMPCY